MSSELSLLLCRFTKITDLLAHLSRRLMGELIVYQSLRRPSVVRPSVCPSVNIFKHFLLKNPWAN